MVSANYKTVLCGFFGSRFFASFLFYFFISSLKANEKVSRASTKTSPWFKRRLTEGREATSWIKNRKRQTFLSILECVFVCVCVCERERERKREIKKEKMRESERGVKKISASVCVI